MALSFLPELLIFILVLPVVVSLYIKFTRSKNSSQPPQDWPMVGILPSLVINLHRLHDYIAVVLASTGKSFMAPVASTTRFFVTCDPANVQHVFTSNHANYPKGEDFAQIFDVTSGSLFTADGESSHRLRVRYQSVLSSPRLLATMANCCRDKVEKGLLPFMARMARIGAPLNMNDLVSRLVFDLYATAVLGVDPCRLSLLDMPPMQVADAMDTVMEVGFVRHIVPLFCWKLMRCLMVGPERRLERRLAAAQGVLRQFTMEMVERRRKTARSIGRLEENEEEQQARATSSSVVDILSNYVNDPEYYENDDHLLQATLITYMIAGRDTIGTTLPWVFYNLAKNPHVVLGIRNELAPVASARKAAAPFVAGATMVFEPEELKALVYLQASLLESIRLYLPIPIERKTVVSSDVMPSGHEVRAGDIVIISIYSMGRMEDLWGPDCREYRPERWLSKDGGKLRHVPSHKFLAFNSGPRMCLGKDIAISQMKTIVAAVLWNFDMVEVPLDGQQAVEPKLSCLPRGVAAGASPVPPRTRPPLQLRGRRGNAADERVLLPGLRSPALRASSSRFPAGVSLNSPPSPQYGAASGMEKEEIWDPDPRRIPAEEESFSLGGDLTTHAARRRCRTGKRDARAWAFTAQLPSGPIRIYTGRWKL